MVVLFIVAVIATIIVNPFKTIGGGSKETYDTHNTHCHPPPPPPVSFSGRAGAGVEDKPPSSEQVNELCALNWFVQGGVPYVVLKTDGGFVTKKVREGKTYEECK